MKVFPAAPKKGKDEKDPEAHDAPNPPTNSEDVIQPDKLMHNFLILFSMILYFLNVGFQLIYSMSHPKECTFQCLTSIFYVTAICWMDFRIHSANKTCVLICGLLHLSWMLNCAIYFFQKDWSNFFNKLAVFAYTILMSGEILRCWIIKSMKCKHPEVLTDSERIRRHNSLMGGLERAGIY